MFTLECRVVCISGGKNQATYRQHLLLAWAGELSKCLAASSEVLEQCHLNRFAVISSNEQTLDSSQSGAQLKESGNMLVWDTPVQAITLPKPVATRDVCTNRC